MSKLLSYLFRPRESPEKSPRERVLAQRERLLRCSLQLLHDPRAAQEVVVKAIGHAVRSPLLRQLSGPGQPAEGDEALCRWLDRLVVGLALSRLRAGPPDPETGTAPPLRTRGASGTLAAPTPPASPPPVVGAGPPRPPSSWPLMPRPSEATPEQVAYAGSRPGAEPISGKSGAFPVLAPVLPPPPRGREHPSEPGDWRGPAAEPPRPRGPDARGAPPAEIEGLERLARQLGRLSPEVRAALVLVVTQGRPIDEAAELIGCSPEGCRYFLNHGRKQLRRALQREIHDGEAGAPAEPPSSPGLPDDLRRGKKTVARA